MQNIESFCNALETLYKELGKRKEYVRESIVKEKLSAVFVEWKKSMEQPLKTLGVGDAVIAELDEHFSALLKLSRKDFFLTKDARNELKGAYTKIRDEVLLPLRCQAVELEAVSKTLLDYANKIKNPDEREFADEALSCLTIKKTRPAIIMSWILVMFKLYSLMEQIGFSKFNAAHQARYNNAKMKLIKKRDDFEYYPDDEVLQVAEDLGILDRNQRRVLVDDCLKLRNMCGHPGKYHPGVKETETFFEKIINIVLAR